MPSVAELKASLAALGQPTNGKKRALQVRLNAATAGTDTVPPDVSEDVSEALSPTERAAEAKKKAESSNAALNKANIALLKAEAEAADATAALKGADDEAVAASAAESTFKAESIRLENAAVAARADADAAEQAAKMAKKGCDAAKKAAKKNGKAAAAASASAGKQLDSPQMPAYAQEMSHKDRGSTGYQIMENRGVKSSNTAVVSQIGASSNTCRLLRAPR